MDVASLELCKELYELSGWVTDDFWQWIEAHQEYELNNGDSMNKAHPEYPAYSLGYLLRELPLNVNGSFFELDHYGTDNGYWVAHYCKHDLNTNVYTYKFGTNGSNPEDAVCEQLIELFKQGILTKGKL